MGYRKIRSALHVADALTVTQAVTMSSGATVTEALTCSTGITVASTASLATRLNASTSVSIGGAPIMNVASYSASTTIAEAGGMIVLASSDATASTYTLPLSTAGTMFYIFFSSGPDNGNPAASAAGCTVRCAANCAFADLISTAAGDGKKTTVKLIGTTGDHFIVVAQSSSQWNVVSYSSNAATSSGA